MNLLTTYRGLVRRPAFLLAVILTMGLGIGANSAIFSVIDAVLLKPLPYPGAERLTAIYESNSRQKAARSDVAPIRLEEWNRMNHTFVALSGAYTENRRRHPDRCPRSSWWLGRRRGCSQSWGPRRLLGGRSRPMRSCRTVLRRR